jgi:cobalt-zinc-cadmium efflux system membrane fusion protein
MKNIVEIWRKGKSPVALLLLLMLMFGSQAQTFAHGGEDHGEAKPKTTASNKGIVSHTARLGEFELMLRHRQLLPDAVGSARLFITRFETNESVDKANPAIEIESANGSSTPGTIEKNDAPGSYTVNIPALPQGTYNIRAKLTYDGETDTATFSGVEVKTPSVASSESGMSWARTALIAFVFALVLGLFAGLIYFVWRFANGEPMGKETVSA